MSQSVIAETVTYMAYDPQAGRLEASYVVGLEDYQFDPPMRATGQGPTEEAARARAEQALKEQTRARTA